MEILKSTLWSTVIYLTEALMVQSYLLGTLVYPRFFVVTAATPIPPRIGAMQG